MKYKITKLLFPLPGDDICIRYIVQKKRHWWNKWQYIMEDTTPYLFTGYQIKKLKEIVYDKRTS